VFGNNFVNDELKYIIGREMIEEIFIEVLSMDIRCFYSNKFDDGF